MYRRPQSCSSRDTLSAGRMRNVFDGSSHYAEMLSTRSNSLQNLNNVRYRDRNANRKPRLAWTRQACSQEENETDSSSRVCNRGKESVFSVAKSQNEKWNSEESKRKSIDIFLARGFVDAADVEPCATAENTGNGDTSLRFRTFGSASGKRLQRLATPTNEKFFVPASVAVDDFSDRGSHTGSDRAKTSCSSYRTEKRVTFASDLLVNRKMDAETRRMHFRNSHSKMGVSRSTRDKQSSLDGVPSARFADYNWQSFSRTSKSAHWPPENEAEAESEKRGCSSANSNCKQSCIKRKLKSCRSRSFHKSLDNATMAADTVDDPPPFIPSSRRGQPEVVTMVSLLTSNDEPDADIDVTAESRLESKTVANDDKYCKEANSKPRDDRMKSGILKTRLSAEKISPLPGRLSSQKTRFTNDTRNSKSIPQSNVKLGRMHSFDNSEISNRARVYEEQEENENKNTVNGEGEGYIVSDKTQSRKEEECWSSFRKMSNKGVYVSFDTILRGLLTPTEYRLRRKEFTEE